MRTRALVALGDLDLVRIRCTNDACETVVSIRLDLPSIYPPANCPGCQRRWQTVYGPRPDAPAQDLLEHLRAHRECQSFTVEFEVDAP